MARTSSPASGTPILPRGTGAFFRRRLAEVAGAVLLGIGFFLIVSLLSYTAGDPSLNSATDGAVQNLMGRSGAWVADLALQSVGIAAVLPAVVAATWGWRLLHKQPPGAIGWRLAALLMSMPLVAVGVAALTSVPFWPAVTLPGGVVGSAAFVAVVGALDAIALPAPELIVTGFGLLVGAAALIAALGIGSDEWRASGRGVVTGSARAAIGTLAMARRGRTLWDEALARRERVEPRLERHRESDLPEIEEPSFPEEPPPFEVATRDSGPRAPMRAERVVEKPPVAKSGRQGATHRQGRLDFDKGHRPPPLDLLDKAPPAHADSTNREALEQNARMLESVLEDFGVRGEIVKVRPGPVVTLYELEPAPGTKTARVIGLADDIARSMSAVSVRIAVIPGRNVIGLELPNAKRDSVHLRELLASEAFERPSGKLTLALGKDISGAPVVADLARMPHLLIAGTTGSGKSVGMNAMILALLFQLPPEKCRLIMIDPKMLELSVYEGIPHLLCPVVTEPGKAVMALKWTVREMEQRYRCMSQLGVRNIAGYNARIEEALRKGETLTRRVQTGFESGTGRPIFEEQPLDMEPLPFIVVVVDEMADLMLVAGKDIEAAVQRLAQMARAAGIHLIMATQRPSVDVITGTIKANFPTRISFQVTSKIDSRTILGEQGAEQLLGQGDMLYMIGGGRISRVHGPFVSDAEVERVVAYLKSQGSPDYLEEVTEESDEGPAGFSPSGGESGASEGDGLFDQAVALVAREGKVSTSFIQRYLQIGYNRAARIVERMEAEGMISKPDRVGRREVLLGRASAED